MTFSALSYLVWYRKYKGFVKDIVTANDYAGAKARLEALIAERQATGMPEDDTSNQLKHSLEHLDRFISTTNADTLQLQRVNRILDE